jgi:hypothetical protein
LSGLRLLLPCARLHFGAPRGRELLVQVGEIGLGLLEVELRAGARVDELAILRDPLPREVDPGATSAVRAAACFDRALRFSDLRLRALNDSWSSFCCAAALASCACSVLTWSWYGVGSMRNSTSPFLTGRLPSSIGTSITRPRTCETIGTVKRKTRRSAETGANDVERQDHHRQRDDRNDDDGDLRVDVPRQPLELMKISQTKNE